MECVCIHKYSLGTATSWNYTARRQKPTVNPPECLKNRSKPRQLPQIAPKRRDTSKNGRRPSICFNGFWQTTPDSLFYSKRLVTTGYTLASGRRMLSVHHLPAIHIKRLASDIACPR